MARTASTSTMNILDLERVLNDRKRLLDKLLKKRTKAQAKVDAVDAEIAKVSGGAISLGGRGPGSRAHNDRPLPDYIEEVLAKNGKPMKVGDIMTGVQAAGYKSNSKSFKNIVNQQLIKERKRFNQVSRGLYGLLKK
jgi:HB1, ASXL, restriction endonuclease HTH domain